MTDAAVIPLPERTPDFVVGSNVRYLMNDRDVDQPTLAARIGIDQSTLSLKLRGKRKWTVSELVTVSDIFNVSIDALARRRDLDPIPGGGSTFHGERPLARGFLKLVGPDGFEPPTSSV